MVVGIKVTASPGETMFYKVLYKKYSKLVSNISKDMVPLIKNRYRVLGFDNTGSLIDSVKQSRVKNNIYHVEVGDETTVNTKGINYAFMIEKGYGPEYFTSRGPRPGAKKFNVPKGQSVKRSKYPAANAVDYAFREAKKRRNIE